MRGSDLISFRANQPDLLISDQASSGLNVEINYIESVVIETNITLGDLWLTYGEAEWGWTFHPREGEPASQHQIGYQDLVSFGFRNPPAYCSPDQFRKLLNEKVSLWIGRDMKVYPYSDGAIVHPTLWYFANDTLKYGCHK